MKKLVIIAALAALAMPVSAQGFLGKMLKAVTAEQPAKTETEAKSIAASSAPWADYFSLDIVSCEGDPVSGEVLLTLEARKGAARRLEIGGNKQNFAVDANGKRYTLNQLNHRSRGNKELFDGVPQRYQMLATGVTPGTSQFPVVTLSYYANGEHNLGSNMSGVDPIRLEGVAVNWAPKPEGALVTMPWQLKEICNVSVASCTRNPNDNSVSLVLAVSTASPKVNLRFNDGHPVDVYDLAGNACTVTYAGSEGISGCNLDAVVPTRFVYTISGLDPGATEVPIVKAPFYAVDHANDLNVGSNMSDIGPIIIRSIPVRNP